MSLKTYNGYITRIRKKLEEIKADAPEIFYLTFDELKINKIVSKTLTNFYINTLSDLYENIDLLKDIYNSSDRLHTLFSAINKCLLNKEKIIYHVIESCHDNSNDDETSDDYFAKLCNNLIILLNENNSKAVYDSKTLVYDEKNNKYYNKYTYEYFLRMANWSLRAEVVKNEDLIVTTKTGFKFYLGSKLEVAVFNYFNKRDDVVDIRGQDFIIQYSKREFTHEYHPDLVVYFIDGTIGIYEVKTPILMVKNDVQMKFLAMKNYSNNNGFKCEMLGMYSNHSRPYTYTELSKRIYRKSLKDYIDKILDERNVFYPLDLINFAKLHNIHGNSNRNKLNYDFVAILIQQFQYYRLYSPKRKSIYSWRVIRKY